MSASSNIEWTDATWNPVTGCTKISVGCKHCYAERLAKRLKAMGNMRYQNGFAVTLHEDLLDVPYRWKKPRKVFVNSMSDLFHEAVPDDFILRVFETMNACSHHQFQILTKRRRLLEITGKVEWTPNIWIGVSVERACFYNRIHYLTKTGARIKFLSCEPLLGQLSRLPLDGIDWVIVGGESGKDARKMSIDWVRSIKAQCRVRGIPFFFKQWGAFGEDGIRRTKKANGRSLDNRTYDEMPVGAHSYMRPNAVKP